MANTPTREHREASIELAEYLCEAFSQKPWREVQDRILKMLADAEQLGRETERAEVVRHLRAGLSTQDRVNLSHDIARGKHLAKEE